MSGGSGRSWALGIAGRRRALRRWLVAGALAVVVAIAVATGMARAAGSPAARQGANGDPVTITLVVVGLQSDPSRALQLSFTGGFSTIDQLSSEVAPGDPGIGQFTWQGDQLRIGAQSGETEIQLKLQFELPHPGSAIVGNAQVPDDTMVDAVLPDGTPQLIGGSFTIFTGARLGASRRPTLDLAPKVVERGGHVALLGDVAGRCREGARVVLLSTAFSHRHQVDGRPAVRTVVGPSGVFAAITTLPREVAAGRYPVAARCGARELGTVADLQVRG